MAKILVVDDDIDHRAFVVQLLERLGHVVIAAENGQRCLGILRDQSVDAIITDIFMPGADGIELVTELKKLGSRIPVLGMTGGYKGVIRPYENLFEVLAKAKVLHKPFGAKDLETALKEVLRDAA
jgi:CheY-like chemotaxis protein